MCMYMYMYKVYIYIYIDYDFPIESSIWKRISQPGLNTSYFPKAQPWKMFYGKIHYFYGHFQ